MKTDNKSSVLIKDVVNFVKHVWDICKFVYPREKVLKVKGVALDTRLLSASTLGLMSHMHLSP